MAVNLVAPIEQVILTVGDDLANKAVEIAKGNAPVDTGQLSASINTYKTSKWSWRVLTDAYGWNGFEYPARIEAGEAVYPTKKNYVWFHGQPHLFASASGQSHFMKKTMESLHI